LKKDKEIESRMLEKDPSHRIPAVDEEKICKLMAINKNSGFMAISQGIGTQDPFTFRLAN